MKIDDRCQSSRKRTSENRTGEPWPLEWTLFVGTSVDTFVGALVGAFVGSPWRAALSRLLSWAHSWTHIVGPLIGPLVCQISLSPALCVAQPVRHLLKFRRVAEEPTRNCQLEPPERRNWNRTFLLKHYTNTVRTYLQKNHPNQRPEEARSVLNPTLIQT